MPTNQYFGGPWDADPRRWERCCAQAATQMVAEGWPPKAGKFSEVQKRRAMRLWRLA